MMVRLSLCGIAAVLAIASAAQAAEVAVSRADCRKLVEATPDNDVNFQPGVDVHGNKVAPADLGGGYQMALPDEIKIPIGIDLADRLGIAQARNQGVTNPTEVNRPLLPYTGVGTIGTVTLRGNTAYWNDQPLAPQDQAEIAAACRSRLEAATPPPPKPNPPDK